MEDLKAKLAVQEVELWQRNTDIEALIAKIGQQTDKLNQERAVADAEEQRVRLWVILEASQAAKEWTRNLVLPELQHIEANFIPFPLREPQGVREEE